MQRRRHIWGSTLLLGAILAAAMSLSACSNDLYASCTLEEGTACTSAKPGVSVSCVEEQNLQCETQICARYKGSEPFCTTTCEVDGDCVAGVCRTFPFGSTTGYCVEETDA
jgi:hypothetical protein